jgi:ankyrin repeat protein
MKILHAHGVPVAYPNHSGQTFVHLLDPRVYGRGLPDVLSWAVLNGLDLSARDCDGKTPFHRLFSNTMTLSNVHDLMPFLAAAGRSLTFLDRDGNTALDTLKVNWLKANHGVHLPQLEAKLVAYNIPLASRRSIHQGSGLASPSPAADIPGFGSLHNMADDTINVISRSEHEPYCQDSLNRNVLHMLAAFSFHANYQTAYNMPPCKLLECLQQRLHNFRSVSIDVNQYSSDGFTPLQSFLVATFDIDMDIPWLVPACVDELLAYGADPTLRDRSGNTALHLACSRGRFECAGKIINHLSRYNSMMKYNQCLSAVNDDGKNVVAFATASMSTSPCETNERRKQCIGLVQAALGEPLDADTTARHASTPFPCSPSDPPKRYWSANLPDNRRKASIGESPTRPLFGHRRAPSLSSITSSVRRFSGEITSAFED